MKILKSIIVVSVFVSLSCLWGLYFVRNVEVSKLSSDIAEIRATIAQQPQEHNLFDTNNVNTPWRLESSDSSVIYREGRTRKIVIHYYSK
jgi:hypothetical protein